MIIKAILSQVKEIQQLIGSFAQKRKMLPRSLNYLYENLRDYWVYMENKKVIGCCALHIVGWNDLAEIKSLSVKQNSQQQGFGKQLVQKCLEEAKQLGIKNVFALTYIPEFFQKLGFKIINKDKLPHKIWSDCIDCQFFPDCNETAVWKKL